ncbi:MAG: THUMP domain-containing protein, partial [Promethearchaeota archaeon]
MSTPLKPDRVLVRYGEIGLKTPGVRRYLEGLLSNHLGVMLTRQVVSYSKITRERGRFFIQTTDAETAAEAASRVFGVVSTSPVWTVSSNPDKIINQVKALTSSFISEGQSFAVRVRRVKTHPFTSQEIASQVGAAIIEVTGQKHSAAPVDLDNPNVEIHIEIREKSSYIFTTVIEGPGG